MQGPGNPVNQHYGCENSGHVELNAKIHSEGQGCWSKHASNRVMEEVIQKILKLTLVNELFVHFSLILTAFSKSVLPGVEFESFDVLESLVDFI
jgi:hypothetical protein